MLLIINIIIKTNNCELYNILLKPGYLLKICVYICVTITHNIPGTQSFEKQFLLNRLQNIASPTDCFLILRLICLRDC